MLVDVVDIVEAKNDNLLWPYYRVASRWLVVRIVELQQCLSESNTSSR